MRKNLLLPREKGLAALGTKLLALLALGRWEGNKRVLRQCKSLFLHVNFAPISSHFWVVLPFKNI